MLSLSHPLVLGSASPRRQQLLQGMGFTFTTRVLEVDESFPPDMDITQVAEFLAKKSRCTQEAAEKRIADYCRYHSCVRR